MARDQSGVNRSRPRFIHAHKIDAPLAVAHVPEIRGASVELGFGPSPPDTVMMDMVRRKIVGHNFSRERANGMEVSAPLEKSFDIFAGQSTRLGLIIEQRVFRRAKRILFVIFHNRDSVHRNLGRRSFHEPEDGLFALAEVWQNKRDAVLGIHLEREKFALSVAKPRAGNAR